MNICPICKFNYSDKLLVLVVDAIINGDRIRMCPLCYGELHKKLHGQKWQPSGLIAKEMLKQAKQQRKLQKKK
jgi:hypothetical protein